jgi:hypothetical protein
MTQAWVRSGVLRPGEGLRPTGEAAAAVCAASVALLALGGSGVLAALIPWFEQGLAELSRFFLPGGAQLGVYGGQQLIMLLAWGVSWAILHARWRRRQVSLTATSAVLVASLVCTALLLWPPVTRALIPLAALVSRLA